MSGDFKKNGRDATISGSQVHSDTRECLDPRGSEHALASLLGGACASGGKGGLGSSLPLDAGDGWLGVSGRDPPCTSDSSMCTCHCSVAGGWENKTGTKDDAGRVKRYARGSARGWARVTRAAMWGKPEIIDFSTFTL